MIFLFGVLSNWRFHFLDNDPVHLIPACPRITTRVVCDGTTSNAETNSYFPSSNPTTVALYVIRSMNVQVQILVQGTINWGWVATLCIVEGKVPSFTAVCTACDANVSHVNHTKV